MDYILTSYLEILRMLRRPMPNERSRECVAERGDKFHVLHPIPDALEPIEHTETISVISNVYLLRIK